MQAAREGCKIVTSGKLPHNEISRKSFLGGMAAAIATGGGGCVSVSTVQEQRTAAPSVDWRPSTRWRGFNLLGMFRCPSIGLVRDPRVDGHFVEWEFKALHDWGFNFARLPLDYRILVSGDSWTNLDEKKMVLLDEAVEWGRKYGIHVQGDGGGLPGGD